MSAIKAWFTSGDGRRFKLDRQPDLEFVPATAAPDPGGPGEMIHVDPATTYQSILGIGSSLEEASVYHLSRMSEGTRERVIRDLVDPGQGVGWNLFRVCLGSSDFTGRPYYSYDDLPPGETDVALERFSIQKDIDYGIVDVIHQVRRINPNVLIFASPWSPPGWMKSGGSTCGGRLLPEYVDVAARYYAMAVQAYAGQGIPLHAITLQNEPLMVHKGYPTCYQSWEDQAALLRAVRAEFDRHGINTQIWIFDHNFNEAMTYPGRILHDPALYAATDGVAFHSYEGRPAQMGELHDAYPEKDLYFTERSTFGARGVDAILCYFRNWARSYNAWVTCLDDRQQPNAGPHPCSPTFVTVNRHDPDDVRYIAEYYLLGQISRFVRRGAVRVESPYGSPQTVTNAAFLNPDGTMALVAVNQTRREQRLTIALPGARCAAILPAMTVATYTWTVA
jgi:glucosylceramidase